MTVLFTVPAPVMPVVRLRYWRDWEPARYAATRVNVVVVGVRAPVSGDLTYLPHTVIILGL